MGVSVWQVLIFLLPVVLFAAAYFTTARDKSLNRMEFFLRFLVLLLAGSFAVLLTSSRFLDSGVSAGVMLLLGIAIGYLNLRFQIMRLQHIGWSPFLALLAYVPILNVVFVLVLVFVPGKAKPGPEVFS